MAYQDDDGLNELENSVMKNKRIYFAILANTNEEALTAQVQNIRHFNPDAGIIVYNGGTDPDYGKKLNIVLYPKSHPIQYGNLTPYFWEIMVWLEEMHVEYDYLINLDHDVLFLKPGFQDYIDKLMKNYDVMGWHMVTTLSPEDTDLTCCHDMWNAWDTWRPFFETEYFIRFLNSTQVYRHGIIRRMLETVDHRLVKDMIESNKVFALEEMFFVTLADSIGGRIREYPREDNWKSVARFGLEQISLKEAREAMTHPYYYWVHPVKEACLISMNRSLLGIGEEEALTDEPQPQEAAPSGGDVPVKVILRKKKKTVRKYKQVKVRNKVGKKKKIVKLKKRKPNPAKSTKRKRKLWRDYHGYPRKWGLEKRGYSKKQKNVFRPACA